MSADLRTEQLRQDRRFLADRMRDRGSRALSWVGMSSDAMTFVAMQAADDGALPDAWAERTDHPRDEGDFGRCMATYAAAPVHLRPWMWQVLQVFRRHVDGLNAEREAERKAYAEKQAARTPEQVAADEEFDRRLAEEDDDA